MIIWPKIVLKSSNVIYVILTVKLRSTWYFIIILCMQMSCSTIMIMNKIIYNFCSNISDCRSLREGYQKILFHLLFIRIKKNKKTRGKFELF